MRLTPRIERLERMAITIPLDTTKDEWIRFIHLIGGGPASTLREAVHELDDVIDQHESRTAATGPRYGWARTEDPCD